jgi:hypothetical protein
MQQVKQIIFIIRTVCIFSLQTVFAQAQTIELSAGEPLLLRFSYLSAGQTSPQKEIRFKVSNLVAPLNITAPAGFEISKNNVSYASNLTFNISELSASNLLFIRFKPIENNKGYGGSLLFTSAGTEMSRPDLSASSLPEEMSLDVVSWNISWLGSEFNGPSNDILQAQHAIRVMDSLKADIYLLQEIVDTSLLGFISRNLKNGPYDYRVCLYASNALNTLSGNWRVGQKMAYLYKKNLFSNVTTRGFTANSTNSNNFYYWASGRYPFRMDATVHIAGKSKKVSFINLHAKAELGEPSDYYRRKGGADLMYDSLTYNHADEYFMIGGDFNDDLDVTISQSVPETLTPYYSYMSDDFRFNAISFWNSKRGDNSYIGYPNVIDHAIVSYQMARDYVPFSCILRKEVTDWIPNYRNDLSDHYPVESRFDLQQSPSNLITSVGQIQGLKESVQILHHLNAEPMVRFLTPITGGSAIRLIASDGKIVWTERLRSIPAGTSYRIPTSGLGQGVYILIITTPEGILTEKIIR